MNTKQSRDRKATKTAILTAAVTVFTQKGPDAATTAEIAKLAGVNQSLLHYHFGSKERLFAASVEEFDRSYASDFSQAMRPFQAEADKDEPANPDGFQAYFDLLAQRSDAVRMMGWIDLFLQHDPDRLNQPSEKAATNDDQAYMYAFSDAFLEHFKTLQAQGQVREDIDPAVILLTVWCLTEGFHLAKERMKKRLSPHLAKTINDDTFKQAALAIFKKGVMV